MKKCLLALLCIAMITPAYGCAIAVTANVDMPDAFARQADRLTLAAYAADNGNTIELTPELPEKDSKSREAESVPEAGAQPEAVIVPFSSPEMPPANEAVIEPAAPNPEVQPISPLSAEPTVVPTSEPTAEPTSEPTAEPTSEMKPENTKEPDYTVEKTERTDGYVHAGSVNLRSGPDTDYEILGEYEQYDELVIKGVCEDWYQVKIDGKTGFMLKEYVEKGAVPTPTPEPTPEPTPKPTPEPTPEPVQPASIQAPSVNTSTLTEDLYLAAQLVNEESGADGYLAVANVIYNRVLSSKFPNSIQGVVFQSNQFTPSESEAELRAVAPSSGAIAAVQQIFVDGNRILPENVLYFRSARNGTSWGGRTYYATIGGNAFFS